MKVQAKQVIYIVALGLRDRTEAVTGLGFVTAREYDKIFTEYTID